MPTYTTLTSGPRTKVLRVTATNDAATVTSFTDADTARTVVTALNQIGSDIPGLIENVLTSEGITLPDVDWALDPSDAADTFVHAAAHTDPVDTTRRLLARYDQHTTTGTPDHTDPFAVLRHAVADQPDSVQRAIRDELTTLTTGYDDVPVIAYAYDRKWGDCSWTVLVTGALNRLDKDALTRSLQIGDIGAALDNLEATGETEIPLSVRDVAQAGYLTTRPHPGQMRAWLGRHQPDLIEVFNTGLRRDGVTA